MKPRVFHGVRSTGAIGYYASIYLKDKGYDSTYAVHYNLGPYDDVDIDLKLKDHNIIVQGWIMLKFFLKALTRYDIFNFYAGATLLPLSLDLPFLRLFGKKIVMTYCGSEVRLIKDVEKKRNPYFHLMKTGENQARFDGLKKIFMRWQNLWIHKFFAARNMYFYMKGYISEKKMVKESIGSIALGKLDQNILNKKITTRKIPVIVHAPTNKDIKGTRYVEDALDLLKKEGYNFSYKRIEGVTNEKARKMYMDSDIIIDQLLLGEYGLLAIEGMYYGKPVVAYLIDDGHDEKKRVPLFNTNIDNVKERLAELISDPGLRVELGKKGREFVKAFADPEKLGAVLEKIYREFGYE